MTVTSPPAGSQPPEISSVGVTSSPPTGILDSIIGSTVNPHTRAGDILGRTAAAAGAEYVEELTPPGTAKGILGFESMLEKMDASKVIEEHSSMVIISSSRKTKSCGVIMRDKCKPRVFQPFLSTMYGGGRPRFGVVKVTGSEGRLKIIKFESDTPTVEMKPDHQQEDISDDENNREEMTTGDHHHHHEKNQTKLHYGMRMESLWSESFSEKMDLMCKIINESSRLISGAMKTYGVTRDNMSPNPKATSFPPTLYTVDSRRRSILSSKKAVGIDGVSNEEMIGYRRDDCGNDASDNGDDRQEEVGNNNGESNEEETLGDHQDDDDNQTEEMAGDHGKNSKKKNKNNNSNNKKKKKNKRKKT